jgi:hypothetical protein
MAWLTAVELRVDLQLHRPRRQREGDGLLLLPDSDAGLVGLIDAVHVHGHWQFQVVHRPRLRLLNHGSQTIAVTLGFCTRLADPELRCACALPTVGKNHPAVHR